MDESSNWWDDLTSGVSDVVDNISSAVSDFTSSISDGLSTAFSDGIPESLAEIVPKSEANYGNYGAGGYDDPALNTMKAASNVPSSSASDGWGDTFATFLKKDNNAITLLKLGLGAVSEMNKQSAAKDAAEARAKAEAGLLTQKDNLDQAANQRFSQSITGMTPAVVNKPKPLTRLDGSRVFTPSGLINQGAK